MCRDLARALRVADERALAAVQGMRQAVETDRNRSKEEYVNLMDSVVGYDRDVNASLD